MEFSDSSPTPITHLIEIKYCSGVELLIAQKFISSLLLRSEREASFC